MEPLLLLCHRSTPTRRESYISKTLGSGQIYHIHRETT
ncbi:hypothetical protein ACJIZ3_023521 [Penstemon smallii]|uniref:Uncharacterized protein n=1 Tax=Penstemon smallii TaxID=265156 RepID=A0ABD3TRP2_9LAMI